MSTTWDSFFKSIRIDFDKTIEEISEEVLADWRELIWTEFYLAVPESDSYIRSYETIKSLSILNIKKIKNSIEIEIGYDDSKIRTFQNKSWTAHEDPSKMGQLFEFGSIYGHDPKGIRAVEDMYKKITSPWFVNKFKELMNKKGYTVK